MGSGTVAGRGGSRRRDIPSVSIADAMVLAVYIPPHAPGPGQACRTTSSLFMHHSQQLATSHHGAGEPHDAEPSFVVDLLRHKLAVRLDGRADVVIVIYLLINNHAWKAEMMSSESLDN